MPLEYSTMPLDKCIDFSAPKPKYLESQFALCPLRVARQPRLLFNLRRLGISSFHRACQWYERVFENAARDYEVMPMGCLELQTTGAVGLVT